MALSDLSIDKFRGIDHLKLDPLGRSDLIAGKNGAGKTAVLEALWVLGGPDIPELTLRLGVFRGIHPPTPETVFLDLFHKFNANRPIKIEAAVDFGSKVRSLSISHRQRESIQSRAVQIPQQIEAGFERSAQIQREGQFELVLDYIHDNGRSYWSRAWWIEEIVTPRPEIPVPFELTNAGIHEERSQVPGRVKLGLHGVSSP